ncbi:MAG: hypothetical protein AAFX99_00255 [Myxococcota bacterium]
MAKTGCDGDRDGRGELMRIVTGGHDSRGGLMRSVVMARYTRSILHLF